ncbi:hypothetical protein COV17_03500 [Candidatus Woesearchaeota archaeon CG10_big_fil_rev_8_21_14_0_10_36_11]|nr:MAG: hypothetical protein COV17_03500 [Candidatus Woesearchaeota archaeon CG10_big_fil_rev_8_21_14_0_10_36_11]
MTKVDLHAHTNESDGELSPKEFVDQAISCGLKAVAITDHDTIYGCAQAVEYAKDKDIEIIPGIEISCTDKEKGFVEIHVIGLCIDYMDKDFITFCEKVRGERIGQKKRMIEKLQELGFDITFDEVVRIANYSFGRPHVAAILMKKYPDRFPDMKSVFDQYLGNDRPGFIAREFYPTIGEAITLITNAGGVPILAHPGVYDEVRVIELIEYFVSLGGKGIETYYPYDKINRISKEDSDRLNVQFKEYAEKHSLLQSGGSDFHGPKRKPVVLGELDIFYDVLEKIKSKSQA